MTFATGNEDKVWAKTEATYDTALAIAATDAVDLLKLDIQPFLNHEEIRSHVGTASLQGETESDRGGKWSATAYLAKTNAAGTPPDIGPDLLKAAFGQETIAGSVTYAFVDTAPGSVQLVRYTGSALYQIINGCAVEDWKIEFDGNKAALITLSGFFASYGFLYGAPTVNGAQSSSATSIPINSSFAGSVGVNALIKFGSEDNAGAGYRVTAVSSDGLTLTISPGLANGISNGAVIAAVVPSQTLTGTVRDGVSAGLSVDGTNLDIIKGSITCKTGNKAIEGEATRNRPRGLVRGDRRLECDVTANYEHTWGPALGNAWNNTLRALIFRAGPNTSGQRALMNLSKTRLDVTVIDIPEAEEATVNIKGKARQNAAAADEGTLVYS